MKMVKTYVTSRGLFQKGQGHKSCINNMSNQANINE